MKRFSDTFRFSEVWYQTLPLELKCAFEYIWAHCDNAGVWMENRGLADFVLGKKIPWDKLAELIPERIIYDGKRWVLVGFVEMQFGKLSGDSRVHKSVIDLLKKHGLLHEDSLSIVYPQSEIGYTIGFQEAPDSPKDKNKEKDKNSGERVQGEGSKARARTSDEVSAYCVQLGLPASDGKWFFDKMEGQGWCNGGNPVKDWRATIRSWQHGKFMMSQKGHSNGTHQPVLPNHDAGF